MPITQPLTRRLQRIQRRLQIQSIALAFLKGAVTYFTAFLVLSLADLLFGIRENVMAILGSLVLGGCVIIGIRILFRGAAVHSLPSLARSVEAAHPEYLDSFICAVELEQKEALNHIERELLTEVQGRMSQGKVLEQVFRRSLSPVRLVLLLVLSALCIANTLRCRSWTKFQYGLKNPEGNCGIVLEYPEHDTPMHGDVAIQAKILRWEQKAVLQCIHADGSSSSYEMNRGEDGFRFTFYDLTESLSFRVRTPSLQTAWQTLRVYEPPVAEEQRMTLIPPPYTGQEPSTETQIHSVELVEGTRMNISFRSATGVTADIHPEGKEALAMVTDEDGRLTAEIFPRQSATHRILLKDAGGHTAEILFDVTCQPDLPPVLAVQEPEGDAQVKPGDSIRLSFTASDDFGLSGLALLYSVNGSERKRLELKQRGAHPEKEWEYSGLWELPALGIKEGDVLSCMAVASDNREPSPQQARSNLFFIVVRPDPSQAEMDMPASGAQKKADVSDLIAESKRLLRFTWDTLSLEEGTLKQRSTSELPPALHDLELAIRKRVVELANLSGAPVGGTLGASFQAALDALGTASRLAERALLEESIPYQERALASLIAAETELIRNAIRAKNAQGENDDGQNDSQNQNGKKNENSKEKPDTKETLKALKEQLQRLRMATQRQEELITAIGRQDTVPGTLAARQNAIRQESDAIGNALAKIAPAQSAAASLGNASAEMEHGAEALQSSSRQLGGVHAARARLQMLAAIRSLEEAIRHASANQVSQLAGQAGELAKAQQDEAEHSSQKPTDVKEARARQEQLNQRTQELLQKASGTASELEEQFPDAAQEVLDALQAATRQGLQKAQTRAKNALLYKRFEKAAKEQTDAANYLQNLARNLQKAASSIPSMTEEQLRETLEKLQEAASKIQSAQKDKDNERARQRMQNARSEAAKDLQDAAQHGQNQNLREISDALGDSLDGTSVPEAGQISLQQLSMAAQILNSMLDNLTRQKAKALQKRTTPPPEKYRRQVEEYFKAIGQD